MCKQKEKLFDMNAPPLVSYISMGGRVAVAPQYWRNKFINISDNMSIYDASTSLQPHHLKGPRFAPFGNIF